PLLGAPRRIADAGRVIADDQHSDVPLVLERAHALKPDAISQGDTRGGDVDAHLHAQRPTEPQLGLEAAFRQDVGRMASQTVDHRRARLPPPWRSSGEIRAGGNVGGSASPDSSPSSSSSESWV